MDEALRRLAHVLGAANSRPVSKPEFYCIKDFVCRAVGQPDGFDYQRIEYECWSCGGSGRGEWETDFECYRCDGDGIYDTAVIELARIRIGDRTFHKPIRKVLDRRGVQINIRGLVKHDAPTWSLTANVAIGRLFDHAYYWHCLQAVPADRFGLTVKQSENLCSWMMMGEWKAVRHAVPAAQNWLQQRGDRMSP